MNLLRKISVTYNGVDKNTKESSSLTNIICPLNRRLSSLKLEFPLPYALR